MSILLPTIAPTIPSSEIRAAAKANAFIHHLCQSGIISFIRHALLQLLIGRKALRLRSTSPINNIMLIATAAPIKL